MYKMKRTEESASADSVVGWYYVIRPFQYDNQEGLHHRKSLTLTRWPEI
jgi:hypothetical protein